MDDDSASDGDEERWTPIPLTPVAAKMKPLTDEVMQAIEDSDIKTNNHTLVGRIKKAVLRPRPSRAHASGQVALQELATAHLASGA